MQRTALLSLAASAAIATSASAALQMYEPFDYPSTAPINDGAFLGDGNQGGGLGLGAWTQVNSGSNEIDVASPGMTFTDNFGNVLPVAGNTMERINRVGQAAVNSPINPGATAALTADNTTLWMTYLFQDRGFSGPDMAIVLSSETMNFGDAQALTAPGFAVGVGINGVGGAARAIGSVVYTNSTGQSFTPENPASMDGPGTSDLRLLSMKVNWNPAGTPDEIFVFDLTEADISVEPLESSAIASDTFDWTQAQQSSLDVLGINESQVNFLDEIRVSTTYLESVGIPEPASLALLSLGGLLLVRRR